MIYILILLSLILVVAAVFALIWAINKGQFEDLDSPAYAIFDEEDNEDKKE